MALDEQLAILGRDSLHAAEATSMVCGVDIVIIYASGGMSFS